MNKICKNNFTAKLNVLLFCLFISTKIKFGKQIEKYFISFEIFSDRLGKMLF